MREIWPGDEAGAVAGGVGLDRRLRLPRGVRGRSTGLIRFARLAVGTLCGLGFALFPGFAVLAIQLCLVLVWAYLMVSLVVGGLRGASRGLR